MLTSFKDIRKEIKNGPMKTIAIAQAVDEVTIALVEEAVQDNIANFILVGDEEKLKKFLSEKPEIEKHCKIVHGTTDQECAEKTIALVKNKQADVAMKGLLATATFMRAVLDKEKGLRTNRLISEVAIVEKNEQVEVAPGLHFITDCAMNVNPSLNEKVKIVENAVEVARRLGVEKPNVAVVTAVEVVNEKMPETLDAAILSKMSDRGQIKNCVIDGPFALDNAISVKAAHHKGITSDIAGRADILLMSDIRMGNVLYKSLTYYAKKHLASVIVGTSAPIVMASRSDSVEDKLLSLCTSLYLAE